MVEIKLVINVKFWDGIFEKVDVEWKFCGFGKVIFLLCFLLWEIIGCLVVYFNFMIIKEVFLGRLFVGLGFGGIIVFVWCVYVYIFIFLSFVC